MCRLKVVFDLPVNVVYITVGIVATVDEGAAVGVRHRPRCPEGRLRVEALDGAFDGPVARQRELEGGAAPCALVPPEYALVAFGCEIRAFEGVGEGQGRHCEAYGAGVVDGLDDVERRFAHLGSLSGRPLPASAVGAHLGVWYAAPVAVPDFCARLSVVHRATVDIEVVGVLDGLAHVDARVQRVVLDVALHLPGISQVADLLHVVLSYHLCWHGVLAAVLIVEAAGSEGDGAVVLPYVVTLGGAGLVLHEAHPEQQWLDGGDRLPLTLSEVPGRDVQVVRVGVAVDVALARGSVGGVVVLVGDPDVPAPHDVARGILHAEDGVAGSYVVLLDLESQVAVVGGGVDVVAVDEVELVLPYDVGRGRCHAGVVLDVRRADVFGLVVDEGGVQGAL